MDADSFRSRGLGRIYADFSDISVGDLDGSYSWY